MRFDIHLWVLLYKCALAVVRITAWPLRQATTLALFELFALLLWDTTLAHSKYIAYTGRALRVRAQSGF